jgi:hypothetical protein
MYASLLPWSKGLKEQDVWPFPWEKETPSTLDEETIKALEERIEARQKKQVQSSKTLELVDLSLLKSKG